MVLNYAVNIGDLKIHYNVITIAVADCNLELCVSLSKGNQTLKHDTDT
jgi:hypothetical protein